MPVEPSNTIPADHPVPGKGHPAQVRAAIISSPRSGNTWLRRLLSSLYEVGEIAAHVPDDFDWAGLPEGCVLQIHWRPTPEFVQRLGEHGFHVVVLARHPFDVLISILHFALCAPSTSHWLAGEGGDETPIFGAMPRSTAFLDYATGARAAGLLSVSSSWWHQPGVHRVRYEDLVRDPYSELARLVAGLDVRARHRPEDAVAANTLDKLRESQSRHSFHFWKGQPGLWKSFLPMAEARQMAEPLAGSFAELGYACDPDPALDARQADANWIKLTWSELAGELQNVWELRQALRVADDRLQAAEQEIETLKARLASAAQLGPLAMHAAGGLRRLSLAHPGLAATFKRIVLGQRG
ncbi:MAG: sulfotransferase domain-containing protein [Pirellulales bacterium]